MTEQRQNESDPSRKAETLGTRDDGGPAFPSNFERVPGMSLRDWFAGQAIDSNMREAVEWYNAGSQCDVYARAASGAYRMADAMLAARKAAREAKVKGGA